MKYGSKFSTESNDVNAFSSVFSSVLFNSDRDELLIFILLFYFLFVILISSVNNVVSIEVYYRATEDQIILIASNASTKTLPGHELSSICIKWFMFFLLNDFICLLQSNKHFFSE